MNILTTQYSLKTKTLEIYIAGCNGPHCNNCHNPETWNFELGKDWREFISPIQLKLKNFDSIIDNVMIFGGEPLDQNKKEFSEFVFQLSYLCNIHNKKLWLFTRYDLIDVDDFFLCCFDYIKCGKYDESITTDSNIQYGIVLSTSNQKIYKKGVDYLI